MWKLLASKLDIHSNKTDVNSEKPLTSGKDKITKDLWKEVSSRASAKEKEQNKARSLAKDLELG